MVHQKNAATNFDFETQGIEMLVSGDWITANGTTLGADNGLGVRFYNGYFIFKNDIAPKSGSVGLLLMKKQE